jgi:hypothetical protein
MTNSLEAVTPATPGVTDDDAVLATAVGATGADAGVTCFVVAIGAAEVVGAAEMVGGANDDVAALHVAVLLAFQVHLVGI